MSKLVCVHSIAPCRKNSIGSAPTSFAYYLFTTDGIADENLAREGVDKSKVHFVGNVMIDTLLKNLPAANRIKQAGKFGLEPRSYASMTLHRPANVDDRDKLIEIIDALVDGLGDLPVVFPAHPRTRQRVKEFGIEDKFSNSPGEPGIWMTDPLGYLEFLDLNSQAKMVLTDSGGLQEETTILGVPCVTIRDNTERPITISEGTNRLAGTSRAGILNAIEDALSCNDQTPNRPEKWDGEAAKRIIEILRNG